MDVILASYCMYIHIWVYFGFFQGGGAKGRGHDLKGAVTYYGDHNLYSVMSGI